MEEVRSAIDDGGAVLVPVGAVEQHFDYLPLGTDSILAAEVARSAAERTGSVVTPPLWFGFSPHHMWGPGTITLRPETLMQAVVDICLSLDAHGFRQIIVINGHRVANLPPLQLAMWRVGEEASAAVHLLDLQDLAARVSDDLALAPFGHGDTSEVTQMLHLRPELVRLEKADSPSRPGEGVRAVAPRGLGEEKPDEVHFPPPLRTAAERRQRGMVGANSRDHALETGAALHSAMVAQVVALIGAFAG